MSDWPFDDLEPRREHSRKPDAIWDRILEHVGPTARIAELFSREGREGVDDWGLEAGKFDGEGAGR